MQTINFRYFIHLYGYKVVLFGLLVLTLLPARAQNDPSENLIDYDEQWIHYGFAMAWHSSRYKTLYSDEFATPALDSLHSVISERLPGFKVAMIANMRLLKYLDFRTMVTVGFYENRLLYRFTDGNSIEELKDQTMVEVPLLLKYKSVRRRNVAMYMIGGFTPALEAAGRGDDLDTRTNLKLRNWNYAVEAGVGFDLYFELFKFSPEIRYSWGMRDMLTNEPNDYTLPIKQLRYQNFSFYITFEGGPTYLKKSKKIKR
ncbi:MAG: PorT family protein [Cyclobacteriaceae bacterium]|nr:PorT family protein [Cyclobacteriaceae bacterium SS2]